MMATDLPPGTMDLMERLCPLNRVFVSDDYRAGLELIDGFLPLRIHEYPPDQTVNGWVVPPSWRPLRGTISRDGRVVYDALAHPLGVAANSCGFSGRLSLEELRPHLHFDHRDPEAIPFHFRWQYRPWEQDWGLCLPRTVYESLGPGEYDVELEVETKPGPLLVATHDLPGRTDECFVLAAHLDHPSMANDDLAGVMVGLAVMRRLAARDRRLSYRLVLVPEIIGSEFYLHDRGASAPESIRGACFLEMLGTETEFTLQRSHGGRSDFDLALAWALADLGLSHRVVDFRQSVGNDEVCWEARGIAMSSLSRYPYPEYHSSRDNMEIISPARLAESVDLILAAVELIEGNRTVQLNFEGVPCLSNPAYDLYIDTGQPALGTKTDDGMLRRKRRLMDSIPILLRNPVTIFDLAESFELPPREVHQYLLDWERRGLVSFK